MMQIEDSYPLSPLQHGMLVHSMTDPRSGAYIQQLVCTLAEELNISAFQNAWRQIVTRHAVFRTRFNWQLSGEPLQEVYREVHLPFAYEDWSDMPRSLREERLQNFLHFDRRRGLKVDEAPLMRLAVFRYSNADYRWVWTSHHALLDGRSRLLVLRELFALYEQFLRGGNLELESPRPYREYVDWLSHQDLSAAEAFWRGALNGCATRISVTAKAATSEAEEAFGEQRVRLSERVTNELLSVAAKYQLTPNTFLQGAWALLLSRYTGERQVVFGAIRAGRHSAVKGAESMVGLVINTLPVCVEVCPRSSVLDWLKELHSHWVAMRAFEHTPLVEIQKWARVPDSMALFDSLVSFENYELGPALQKQSMHVNNQEFRLIGTTNYPLSITGYVGAEFVLDVTYDRGRFEDADIARMLDHLRTLLREMVSRPTATLSDLELLTDREKHQLIVEWNDTRKDYPKEQCIHAIFEQQADRTPDNVALVFGDQEVTYGDLNQRVNQLAGYLRRQGVGAEVLVAVCVERSLEMVIALLGVLKAGGAYLPLDAGYPKDRLAYMLHDTQAPVLLTQKHLAQNVPTKGLRVVCLDADWNLIAHEDKHNLASTTTADNLAYIMYTSGSTGKPKGVSVTHRGVIRLVKGSDYADLSEREVFLQFAPLSFDASTFEIWAALLNGGKLVLLPPHMPSLEELGDAVANSRVSTLWLTSALFQLLVENHLESLTRVKQLLAGGDILPVAPAIKLLNELPGCRLINGYGPTENTTFSCCHPMNSAADVGASVSIGRPISNTQAYILDSYLNPAPIGVAGELHTGGDGLARGYFNNPELTADKFVPDPFSSEPGRRLYRTGDLARYRADGNIEFLGRMDQQVKIRGFRIEPGEIETQLAEHPSVATVAAAVREEAGEKRIVAYVVPAPNRSIDIAGLKSFLQQKLPDFMIPAQFVLLDQLPLSPNGKVDRKRLPDPLSEKRWETSASIPPQTPIQRVLAKIWLAVLKLERIGIHDSFFDLGGHSLLATRVVTRIRRELNVDLPLRVVFDRPTLARLSAAVEDAMRNGQRTQTPAVALTRNLRERE
jgi:surfactin family lipopeptide synthetase C